MSFKVRVERVIFVPHWVFFVVTWLLRESVGSMSEDWCPPHPGANDINDLLKCLKTTTFSIQSLVVQGLEKPDLLRELKNTIEERSSCTTGPLCASSCDGLADGYYQHCVECSNFIICHGGSMRRIGCPTGLVWRAVSFGDGFCDWTSGSCRPC